MKEAVQFQNDKMLKQDSSHSRSSCGPGSRSSAQTVYDSKVKEIIFRMTHKPFPGASEIRLQADGHQCVLKNLVIALDRLAADSGFPPNG